MVQNIIKVITRAESENCGAHDINITYVSVNVWTVWVIIVCVTTGYFCCARLESTCA